MSDYRYKQLLESLKKRNIINKTYSSNQHTVNRLENPIEQPQFKSAEEVSLDIPGQTLLAQKRLKSFLYPKDVNTVLVKLQDMDGLTYFNTFYSLLLNDIKGLGKVSPDVFLNILGRFQQKLKETKNTGIILPSQSFSLIKYGKPEEKKGVSFKPTAQPILTEIIEKPIHLSPESTKNMSKINIWEKFIREGDEAYDNSEAFRSFLFSFHKENGGFGKKIRKKYLTNKGLFRSNLKTLSPKEIWDGIKSIVEKRIEELKTKIADREAHKKKFLDSPSDSVGDLIARDNASFLKDEVKEGMPEPSGSGFRIQKLVPLGKMKIDLPLLHKGYISLRTLSGGYISGFSEFRTKPISCNVEKYLLSIANSNGNSINDVSYLSERDKSFLTKLFIRCRLPTSQFKKALVSGSGLKKGKDFASLKKRFEILKGQILAGNDNPRVILEIKELMARLNL